jgi:hypothetical protein
VRLRRRVPLLSPPIFGVAAAFMLVSAAAFGWATAAPVVAAPTPLASSPSAPRVEIFSPSAYQVVQRDAAGWADIVVTGRLIGVSGPIQVRWSTRDWVQTACSKSGWFRVRMRACRQGQGSVVARSARRHLVAATVPHVGVGDIYVIAGQSNASGRGKHLNHAANPVLKAGLFGNDDRWGPLADPTDGAAGQVDEVSRDPDAAGSIWPLVANRLMRREAVPVAFVPCSTGATPLSTWVRDRVRPWSSKTLFGSMLRRVHAVGGRVRAVLFWQGERDARSLVSRSDYAAGLAGLAADVRLVTGGPLVPAQIGDVPLSVWAVVGVDAIRMAQEDVLLAPQPAGGLVPGPVLYDIDLAPGWHPETDTQSAAIADRWTAAIRTGVLGADSARPPVLLAAAYDGVTTVTVTFRVDAGSLVPGAASGFVLRAAGTSLALTGAEVVPPDCVVLHLAEPVPWESRAGLSLSLGSGRDGAGARVPKESSYWHLPAWPFVDAPVATPQAAGTPAS